MGRRMRVAVICESKRDFARWKKHKWNNQEEMDNDGKYVCCSRREDTHGCRFDYIIELFGARYNKEYHEILAEAISRTRNKDIKIENW